MQRFFEPNIIDHSICGTFFDESPTETLQRSHPLPSLGRDRYVELRGHHQQRAAGVQGAVT